MPLGPVHFFLLAGLRCDTGGGQCRYQKIHLNSLRYGNIKTLPLSTFLLNKAPFSLKLQVTGHTDAGLLMLLLQGRPGEYPARGQAASSSTNTAERLYLETGGRVPRRAARIPHAAPAHKYTLASPGVCELESSVT